MIVSVTWVWRPSAPIAGGQRRVDLVQDEVRGDVGVELRDSQRRGLVAERREHPVRGSLERLAADDPGDRDDPVPCILASPIAARTPGSARIGPTDTIGFDGAITTRLADSIASRTSRVVDARSIP
jgi:hypothetical protein